MTDQAYIEYMPLKDLVGRKHIRNPKQHDLGAINTSITRFGYVAPILMDERTGYIVAGHGRIDALADMQRGQEAPPARIEVHNGEWHVPVMRGVAFNSDTEVEAYLVADNRLTELGGWHEAELAGLLQDLALQDEALMLSTGYDLDDLDALLRDLEPPEPIADPGAQIDRAAELRDKWQTERGQVWQVGRHKIMCGDSTNADDVARLMAGVKADAVVTDPPYNIASENHLIAAGKFSKSMTKIKKSDWDHDFDIQPWLISLCDIMANDVSVYIFSSHHLIPDIWNWMKGWSDHYSWCVWNKVDMTPSLTLRHWSWNAELCAYATRGKHVFNHAKGENAPSVWTFQRVNSFGYVKDDGTQNRANDAQHHPTQKPTDLIRHILSYSSSIGQAIYDPFLGSGTTIIACEQTNRVGYGMEIDEGYTAVALERLVGMGLEPILTEAAEG